MYSKTTLKQLWKQVRVALLSIAIAFGLAFPALAADKSCALEVQTVALGTGQTWDSLEDSGTPVYWFEVDTTASNCEWTSEVDNYDGLLATNDRGTSQTDVYFKGPNAEDVRVNNPCVEPMTIEYCPLYESNPSSKQAARATEYPEYPNLSCAGNEASNEIPAGNPWYIPREVKEFSLDCYIPYANAIKFSHETPLANEVYITSKGVYDASLYVNEDEEVIGEIVAAGDCTVEFCPSEGN